MASLDVKLTCEPEANVELKEGRAVLAEHLQINGTKFLGVPSDRCPAVDRKMIMSFSSDVATKLKGVAPKPIPVPVRTINLQLTVGETVNDLSKAFVSEGYRKNPQLAERINLTEDELTSYCNYLVAKRVQIVNDECRDWRYVKLLAMPCFIEMMLTAVGKVSLKAQAIEIYPVSDAPEMTLEEAQNISDKILAFEDDLAIVVGAMPKQVEGDPDVMTMAIINGYVLGMKEINNPVAQYIVYFLGCKVEESMFDNLYYMQYDDVKSIHAEIASLGRVLVR